MNRLNTNKPLQGLEQDNRGHEKNNVRQQKYSQEVYNPKGLPKSSLLSNPYL